MNFVKIYISLSFRKPMEKEKEVKSGLPSPACDMLDIKFISLPFATTVTGSSSGL
jgi:hypothetical protein